MSIGRLSFLEMSIIPHINVSIKTIAKKIPAGFDRLLILKLILKMCKKEFALLGMVHSVIQTSLPARKAAPSIFNSLLEFIRELARGRGIGPGFRRRQKSRKVSLTFGAIFLPIPEEASALPTKD